MSGRPYARNPRAPYTGPRDLEAILPHTFRLEIPTCVRDAKYEAIRSAIRRRCMQKNWRKMISIRHTRLAGDMAGEKTVEENKPAAKQASTTKDWEELKSTTDAAKKQLQVLERKLQGLTDQKHAKFQLLKDILVEEARSKTTGGGAVAATTTTKKRRVDLHEPRTTSSSAKTQSPVLLTEAASPVATSSSKNPSGKLEDSGC